jgi:lysophospholipase L1-like esterase
MSVFNQYNPDELFLQGDMLHLSEKGHQVVADAIYKYLKTRIIPDSLW